MKGSSSRWDGLRDDDKSPSFSSKQSTRRGISNTGTCSYIRHNLQHASATSRENGANGSGRSHAYSLSSTTTKEAKIRDAINSLRNQTQRNNDTWKCLDEISNLVLIRPDQSRFPGRKGDTSTSQSSTPLPLCLLWDAADCTIRCLRPPGQPISSDLAKKISNTAAEILRLSAGFIQHSLTSDESESFQRPRSMTDLRLCECASIILEFLKNEDRLSIGDTMALIKCKESMFTCLANVLELSATLGLSESNSNNRRSLLFPWGAEKSVNLVVVQSVLPFVSTIMKDESISHSTKIQCCSSSMRCLYLLMRDPSADRPPPIHQLSKHAAAMLAPLIIDVDLNGKENEKTNPLRSSTLQTIVAFWNCLHQLTLDNQSTSLDGIEIGCQCLTVALKSLQALKRGKMHHSGNEVPPIELDIATICSQIQSAFQKEPFCSHPSLLLDIFASLCQAYPSAAASQWHLFLEQSVHQSGTNPSSSPSLLRFIEEGRVATTTKRFDDKSMLILPDALRTTMMLVSAMPFSHWLADENKSNTRFSGANYFASRVRNTMIRLIDCVYNLMTSMRDVIADVQSDDKQGLAHSQLIDSIMIHLSQLAAKLCSTLLFAGQNSMLLLPASNLVSCSGQIVVLCFRAMSDSSPHCAKFYEKIAEIFSHVITETVDVEPNQTISPAQHWLTSSAAFEFIGFLLSQKSLQLESNRMSILCRVARICPWALVREPFNLASFCEICSIQSNPRNGPDCKLSGVKLIESFLVGRRVYSSEFTAIDTSTAIVDTICPILCSSLKDREAKVRAAAVASFAFICESEWYMLLHSQSNVKPDLDWQCIDTILLLCSKKHGENNSRVRSSACKAIGEICTCIITTRCTKEVTAALSRKVCHEMVDALKDETSVRSMCLFTIGNMASALKEQHYEETLIKLLPQLNCLFSFACECLDDKDEKVVTNAIRAVGLLSYFVYSSDFYILEPSTKLNQHHNLLSSLTQKVKSATDLVVEGTPANLSSNQRNNAKKHAWGSCSTIGMLLGYRELWQYHDTTFIQSALFEQFRCLQLSDNLHDKIVAAATTSLVSLPCSFWQSLPKECDSIGRGLASCFCHLYNFSKQKAPTPSYHDEIIILTNTLLAAAKAKDFCHAFILRDDISFSVDFLYRWLVSNDVSFDVMEEITTAIQSTEVQHCIDVSSVQMFISRTAYQVKESNSPSKSFDINEEAQDEDEI